MVCVNDIFFLQFHGFKQFHSYKQFQVFNMLKNNNNNNNTQLEMLHILMLSLMKID